MAKYDWKQLEKDYILGDYKSVSSFLKDKGINKMEVPKRVQKDGKKKRY